MQSSFMLRCGVPALEQIMLGYFASQGFEHDEQSSSVLLLDAPQGFALHGLAELSSSVEQIIVVTQNRCPEYLEDLWDFQPTVLLVSENIQAELEHVMDRLSRGERYRMTPGDITTLSIKEREVLRLVAHGWNNTRIAASRNVEIKTIANAIAALLSKLKLPDRIALAFYYWDQTHLLS